MNAQLPVNVPRPATTPPSVNAPPPGAVLTRVYRSLAPHIVVRASRDPEFERPEPAGALELTHEVLLSHDAQHVQTRTL